MSKYNRDRGLNGFNPLAYVGVEPSTPPQLVQELRPPTVNDYVGYTVGTIWMQKGTEKIWMLANKAAQVADWVYITAGNFAAGGALISDGAGNVTATNGADGQVLIGGGAFPRFNSLTSADGSVVFTPGPNTLDLSAIGGAGFGGLLADDTNVATPDAVTKQIAVTGVGAVGIETTAVPGTLTIGIGESTNNGELLIGGGAGNPTIWGSLTSAGGTVVVTSPAPNVINLEAAGVGGFAGLIDDAGATATPLANKVTVAGTAGLIKTTAAPANTITLDLDYVNNNNLDPDGSFAHDGQLIISSHNSAPAWAKLTAGAGISITPNVNSITITNTGGGGGGGGVNIFDCIVGTCTPNDPANPTKIFVEGDEDITLATNYSNITTISRVYAGFNNRIEIALKPSIALPATTAWSSGVFYLGGRAAVGGSNRFVHSYGTYNTFLGLDAGNLTLTTANARYNTAVGYRALNGLVGAAATQGSQNTAIGYQVLDECTNGAYNTGMGVSVLGKITTGNWNTSIGVGSMRTATTSSYCTAYGADALGLQTTASQNTAIGYQALYSTTTATNNTAIGYQALFSQTASPGGRNVAIGSSAGYALTGNQNAAIGYNAMTAATNSNNAVAVGYYALKAATTATNSVAVGAHAMGTGITTGTANVAVGAYSLNNATTGTGNVAVGSTAPGGATAALEALTTGDGNTAIGQGSLSALLIGNNNTALGINAGSNYAGGETNNIVIKNSGVLGESNTIRIGNSQTAAYMAGVYNQTLGTAPHVVGCDNAGKIGKYLGVGAVFFSAYGRFPESNITGDNTKFYLGANNSFGLEVNYGGGTWVAGGGTPCVYTFPVTGTYLLTFNIRLNGLRAPIVMPPPAPPVAKVDPVVIECTGANYSYYPALKYNGYSQYESVSMTVIAQQNAGDTMKWFLEVDYRPGESVGGAWPLTYNQQSKTIGYDSFDATNFRFTQMSATLLNV